MGAAVTQSKAMKNLKRISEENGVLRKGLRVVTVLRFLDFSVVFDLFFNGLQLDRVHRNYFEIAAALRAGDEFAFIHFFLVNIEISFAFRAINHNGLHPK
jgi:hypothetical protein